MRASTPGDRGQDTDRGQDAGGMRAGICRIPLTTVSGDLLDLILIALAAAFAVAGYRQGFIIGMMSFAGFTCGAVLGSYFAPAVAEAATANHGPPAGVSII